METILDNGVTYVKATALAKKYRYTTDYIGQLCRSGKVDAKLIGRAWFVSEASLTNHKSDRYSGARSAEIAINKSLVSDRESHPVALRREVRPVLSKSAHRSILQIAEPKTYNFESRGAARVSTYHPDDESLEPAVFNPTVKLVTHLEKPVLEEKPKKINVSLGEKATRKLSFEELPEVALRGDLTIDSLDDPDLYTEVKPVRSENLQFAPLSVVKPAVVVTKRYQPRVSTPHAQIEVEDSLPVAVEEVVPVVVTPAKIKPHIVKIETPRPPVKFVVIPVLVTGALVICGVMLGLVSYAETDGLQFSQSLKFSPAAVAESVSKIAESY